MLPSFIGIGPPKAGTTWLFHNLQAHPDVFLPPIKETHFFCRDEVAQQMPREYAAFFEGAPSDAIAGEISTDYICDAAAPERIAYYLPDVRLFTVLRNPLDQVQSHYWHLQRQQFHMWTRRDTPGTFKEALDRFEDLLIEPALYAKHLTRWLKYFDREQLLILFFDDMKSDPRAFLRKLFTHVGADPSFESHKVDLGGSSVRRGTSPRSDAAERVRAFLYEKLVRKVYYPLKKKIGVQRADRIKDALRVREIMDWIFRAEGYPEINPAVRAELEVRFHDDLRALEQLTSRDLSHWIAPQEKMSEAGGGSDDAQ